MIECIELNIPNSVMVELVDTPSFVAACRSARMKREREANELNLHLWVRIPLTLQ